MQALKPVDFAQVVAQDLRDETGIDAGASPVPEDLGAVLPRAVVYCLGGSREGVLDRAVLSVDVYATTPAAAYDACATCCAAVGALSDHSGGSVQWYVSDVTALPYDNPDPRHPTIPRATFAADVVTRPRLIEF